MAQADAALAAGHTVSARDCYVRAAEYFRQAFFFHRENLHNPELVAAYAASVKAFRAALPLLDETAEVIEGTYPGLLLRACRLGRSVPHDPPHRWV